MLVPSVTPLRNAVSSHSQKMKLRWHKMEKQRYNFIPTVASAGGFTFSQLECLITCRPMLNMDICYLQALAK